MSEPRVQYVGETNPSITDTITSSGVAVDLTSSAVRFKMRLIGASTNKVDAVATIVTPASGTVRYDWLSADVDTAGFYVGWWEVTTTGKKQSKPEFLLEFRAHGLTVGNLVELAEVRQSMELKEISDELDDQIEALLPAASQAINLELGREFVQTTNATRTFRIRDRLVDLAPYDLRGGPNGTGIGSIVVTLDPLGGASVLTANTDYYLEPTGGDDFGTYSDVILSNYLVVAPQTLFRFAISELSILGDWGFATVPEVAKKACLITVRSWLRISTASYAHIDPEGPRPMQPDVSGYYALPPAARRLLDPLRRNVGMAI